LSRSCDAWGWNNELDQQSGAPRRFFDTVVWRQFSELHTDLLIYFEETTERLIKEAI